MATEKFEGRCAKCKERIEMGNEFYEKVSIDGTPFKRWILLCESCALKLDEDIKEK